MSTSQTIRVLRKEHDTESIRKRVWQRRGEGYTSDGVLGAIDGGITTFAIVAGTIGGNFPPLVTVVLGMANLVADGFSMAVSNYQATKAGGEEVDSARSEEFRHIDLIPDAEREEVRQIYRKKGFTGETLNQAVEVTTSDPETWVDTMLTDELGLQPVKRNPQRAGITTFLAFTASGLVPLIPFLFPDLLPGSRFAASGIMTALLFFSIGLIKGVVLRRPRLIAAFETLAMGTVAAALAYGVGALLRSLYGNDAL